MRRSSSPRTRTVAVRHHHFGVAERATTSTTAGCVRIIRSSSRRSHGQARRHPCPPVLVLRPTNTARASPARFGRPALAFRSHHHAAAATNPPPASSPALTAMGLVVPPATIAPTVEAAATAHSATARAHSAAPAMPTEKDP